jgi:hypothetical protein
MDLGQQKFSRLAGRFRMWPPITLLSAMSSARVATPPAILTAHLWNALPLHSLKSDSSIDFRCFQGRNKASKNL